MLLVSSIIILILKNEILCSGKPSIEEQDSIENKTEDFPYIVALRITIGGTPFCSGTVINKEWILTAAQCVYDKNPTELYIQYGVLNAETGYAKATQIILHKEFQKETSINNIGIIKLKDPLQLGQFVQSMQLPPIDLVVPAGTLVEHLKWISEENDVETLKKIQKIHLVTSDDCQKNFVLYDPEAVTYKMSNVCGKRPAYKSGICLGYKGAPLMLNGLQVGIHSMGHDYCQYNENPATYTELAHYVNWIFKSINLDNFMHFLSLKQTNPACTIDINSNNIPFFSCLHSENSENVTEELR